MIVGNTNTHRVPLGKKIVDVSLLKQDSWSECRKGVSFGFEGENIWTDDGCRGKFEIKVEGKL